MCEWKERKRRQPFIACPSLVVQSFACCRMLLPPVYLSVCESRISTMRYSNGYGDACSLLTESALFFNYSCSFPALTISHHDVEVRGLQSYFVHRLSSKWHERRGWEKSEILRTDSYFREGKPVSPGISDVLSSCEQLKSRREMRVVNNNEEKEEEERENYT